MFIFCLSAVLSLTFYGLKKHFNSNDKSYIRTYSTLLDKLMHLKMSYLIFKAQKCKICLFLFHFDVEGLAAWKSHSISASFDTIILKLRSMFTESFWTMNERNNVHVFWECQKIWRKSPPYFWLALHRTKVRWRFHKILWPSQNIWTLLCYVNRGTPGYSD